VIDENGAAPDNAPYDVNGIDITDEATLRRQAEAHQRPERSDPAFDFLVESITNRCHDEAGAFEDPGTRPSLFETTAARTPCPEGCEGLPYPAIGTRQRLFGGARPASHPIRRQAPRCKPRQQGFRHPGTRAESGIQGRCVTAARASSE
jgi:hypothetical protein